MARRRRDRDWMWIIIILLLLLFLWLFFFRGPAEQEGMMQPLFFDSDKNPIGGDEMYSIVIYQGQEFWEVYYLGFSVRAENTGEFDLNNVKITQASPSSLQTALQCQGVFNDPANLPIGASKTWVLDNPACIVDTTQFDEMTQTFSIGIYYEWNDELGNPQSDTKSASVTLQFLASKVAVLDVSLSPDLPEAFCGGRAEVYSCHAYDGHPTDCENSYEYDDYYEKYYKCEYDYEEGMDECFMSLIEC